MQKLFILKYCWFWFHSLSSLIVMGFFYIVFVAYHTRKHTHSSDYCVSWLIGRVSFKDLHSHTLLIRQLNIAA